MSGESSKGTVLVVEDESAIADLLRLYLENAGYRAHLVGDGITALSAVAELRPEAVLLDVGLPGIDGIEVCRRLRAGGDWTPVLFVTARDEEIDRVLGLELGADDYITKPFSPREVVARVNSTLRRVHGMPSPERSVQLGEVVLDTKSRRVHVASSEVALTATEFDLLAYLMTNPGQVFDRGQLLRQVWGYSAVAGTRTVDVHVAQLRAKLGDASPVRTVRGVGYSAETS
jgi:DNA-binding response OmpR family regulator